MSAGSRTALKAYAISPGAPADVGHLSTDTSDPFALGLPLDFGLRRLGSVQINWDGITGVADAVFLLFCSNDGARWVPKTRNGSIIQMKVNMTSLGSGQNLLSLNSEIITEEYYQVQYVPNGVTGGTVECLVWGK